jgi:hypothetical protein
LEALPLESLSPEDKTALLEELVSCESSAFNDSFLDACGDEIILSEKVATFFSHVEEKLEYRFRFYIRNDRNTITLIEHGKKLSNISKKLNILLTCTANHATSQNKTAATSLKEIAAASLMNENEFVTLMRDEFKSDLLSAQNEEGDNKKWYDVFELPLFLQQYADCNLPVWIGNAFLACQWKENREYLIKQCTFKVASDDDSKRDNSNKSNKDNSLPQLEINKFLTPVDFRNSGVTENNKVWSNGLQQFLEMKHRLPLSPLPLMTNFLSNVTLFKRYEMIFGASGTLGNNDEADFVRRTYNVGYCAIPEQEQKLFYEVEGLILNGKVEWTEAIRERIEAEIDQEEES